MSGKQESKIKRKTIQSPPVFKGRSKRNISKGFTADHWLAKHKKLKLALKYGGMKNYTYAEIAKHNSPTDCWMILNGYVFDITDYIAYHPGGNEILRASGKDGTQLFLQIHQWVNANALIKNLWIGRVSNYYKENTLNVEIIHDMKLLSKRKRLQKRRQKQMQENSANTNKSGNGKSQELMENKNMDDDEMLSATHGILNINLNPETKVDIIDDISNDNNTNSKQNSDGNEEDDDLSDKLLHQIMSVE